MGVTFFVLLFEISAGKREQRLRHGTRPRGAASSQSREEGIKKREGDNTWEKLLFDF
jgi:hypothetical protein